MNEINKKLNREIEELPAPKAAPKPAPKGKHVQLFKMKRKVGKGFYSVPVNQNESD